MRSLAGPACLLQTRVPRFVGKMILSLLNDFGIFVKSEQTSVARFVLDSRFCCLSVHLSHCLTVAFASAVQLGRCFHLGSESASTCSSEAGRCLPLLAARPALPHGPSLLSRIGPLRSGAADTRWPSHDHGVSRLLAPGLPLLPSVATIDDVSVSNVPGRSPGGLRRSAGWEVAARACAEWAAQIPVPKPSRVRPSPRRPGSFVTGERCLRHGVISTSHV